MIYIAYPRESHSDALRKRYRNRTSAANNYDRHSHNSNNINNDNITSIVMLILTVQKFHRKLRRRYKSNGVGNTSNNRTCSGLMADS